PELKMHYTRLVNHGLIKEVKRGRMFQVTLGPTFHDLRDRHRAELIPYESLMEKVVDLFLRMDTSQAELAASVIYAAKALLTEKSEKPSENDVLRFIMDWKKRRRPALDEAEVAWSIRNLTALRWLPVRFSKDLPISAKHAA
ncbi:MAG: Appr-1-p processing protein, partial [Thermodesulfobacteriota bacterium]